MSTKELCIGGFWMKRKSEFIIPNTHLMHSLGLSSRMRSMTQKTKQAHRSRMQKFNLLYTYDRVALFIEPNFEARSNTARSRATDGRRD